MTDASPERAIFITGAASGIGRATAKLFGERGWFVGAFDVSTDGLHSLSAELGAAPHMTQPLDVSDRPAYLRAVDAFAGRTGGRMDILYNNAGILGSSPYEELAWEAIDRIIRINFVGAMIGVHASMALLRATPGSLCFTTSSASAIFGSANLVAYSATKFAVKGMTEALSIELKKHGVRAADVLPGIIDTAMLTPETKAMLPSEGPWRLIDPREVAEAVWQAYLEDRIHWYVPPELKDFHLQAIAAPEQIRDLFISMGRD